MVPLKLIIKYEPSEIGLIYKRAPTDKETMIYTIRLEGLIFLGDSQKITEKLYKAHSDYLHESKIKPAQIEKLIDKLLDYLKEQLEEYEREQMEYEDEDGDDEGVSDDFAGYDEYL